VSKHQRVVSQYVQHQTDDMEIHIRACYPKSFIEMTENLIGEHGGKPASPRCKFAGWYENVNDTGEDDANHQPDHDVGIEIGYRVMQSADQFAR